MRAEVIPMASVRRENLPSSYEEVLFEGYRLALDDLAFVKRCSRSETIGTFEEWLECGRITRAQFDALMEWHGWRR